MRHRGRIPETQGDVSIRFLWESQTEAIIEIGFGDGDANTCIPARMDRFLASREKTKKEKHGQACYD